MPLATWPSHYPNVAQARFLIESGLPEPIINTLTRIGTVEGFGGMIRLSPVPDRRRTFAEDTDGTALAHLTTGLFEAHARDEAGYDPENGEAEGGHKQMWFAARDVAFGDPPSEDETDLMLRRMGIGQMAKAAPQRLWPDDVSVDLEMLVERMTRLLLIEISAFHTFAWAETLLDDPDLVAGDGEAARLIAYIRADETPHVEYLKTVLTEMRDRTVVGSKQEHAGADLIGRTWDRALAQSLGERHQAAIDTFRSEVAHAASSRPDAADLMAHFDALADPADGGRSMKFGIFYEHQLPRPWTEDSERQLIQDALDQVELADKLGIEYCWEVEHHFLEEYSHSSAPEVFLAAASQRTKDIRLGHGIIQTAPGYNHPARTAERVSMLDLVSNGRVDFGSGESSSEAELGGFRIDPMVKRDQWLEGLQVAVRCMTEAPFTGHEGTYVSMPPRNVVPKPVQKPHPPLWVACSRRDTIMLAAELGIGALTFAFIDPEEARQWIGDYRQRLADKGVAVGKAVNPSVACVTPMMCAKDETEALAMGLEGGNFFGYSLAHYYIFGEHQPGTTDVWQEFLERREEMGYSPEAAIAAEQETLGAKLVAGEREGLRGAVGTPDQLREFLRRYEEAGVDQLIFVMQAGKNRHEDIMASLELFGTEVLPEFKERDEAASMAKARELEPVIEQVLARKVDDAPLLPEGYSMKAYPKQMMEAAGADESFLQQIADKTAVGDSEALGQLG